MTNNIMLITPSPKSASSPSTTIKKKDSTTKHRVPALRARKPLALRPSNSMAHHQGPTAATTTTTRRKIPTGSCCLVFQTPVQHPTRTTLESINDASLLLPDLGSPSSSSFCCHHSLDHQEQEQACSGEQQPLSNSMSRSSQEEEDNMPINNFPVLLLPNFEDDDDNKNAPSHQLPGIAPRPLPSSVQIFLQAFPDA